MLFSLKLTAQTSLIPYGSSWNYLDNGTNEGTAWRASTYDDSGWKTGNAKFGYGINDASTAISYGSSPNKKFITAYFRKSINISDITVFSSFTAQIQRDDGVVVYINGVEVYRNNLPGGTISYTTLATDAKDNGSVSQAFSIASSVFKTGSNIIAVEVHQSKANSPDLAFDMELIGALNTPPTNQPPQVTVSSPVDNASVALGEALTIGAFASDLEGTVANVEFYVEGSKIGEDLTSPYAYSWTPTSVGVFNLTAKATDNTGATTTSAIVKVNVVSAAPTDQTPPSVVSIDRYSPATSTTGASSVTFRTTFTEPVSGVDKTDFLLTVTSGTTSGVLASDCVEPIGTDGSVYDTTVSSLTGSGTIRLDLISSGTGITDAAGNAMINGFNGGKTYTIDQTPPVVLSINRQAPTAETVEATSLTFRVTFSEPVTGVDKTDFNLTVVSGSTTGDLTAEAITAVDTDGAIYDVTVTSINGNGVLRLDLKSADTGVTDAVGNPISGGFTGGQTYTIEQIIAERKTPGEPESIIAYNSSWKYLDNGVDQGISWRTAAYSDDSWKNGYGKFGYGIDDATTIVDYGNSSNKYITTYFRKTINISNPEIYSGYILNIKRDDGVIVYINGSEVIRDNMPSGTVSYNTLASSNIYPDNGTTPIGYRIDPKAFASGNNIIAVEVHQSSATSLDIAFDLELIGFIAPSASDLKITTWNIQNFGFDKDSKGNILYPKDDKLQYENVKKSLQWLNADVFALQEISNDTLLEKLVSELPGYDFVRSEAYSYSVRPTTSEVTPRKLYLVYRTSKITIDRIRPIMKELYDDILSNKVVLDGYPGTSSSAKNDDNLWYSGRLPFMIDLVAHTEGIRRNIKVVNVHAYHGMANITDYERRKYDAQILKDTLDSHFKKHSTILIGDYNDDVDQSIFEGLPSPYKAYVDDEHYNVLTYQLSLKGGGTFNNGKEFRDHITCTGSKSTGYVENSIRIGNELLSIIKNFYSTTSDHLPVSAFIDLTVAVESNYEAPIYNTELNAKYDLQVYPNPFVKQATISFTIENEENFIVTLLDSKGMQVTELRKGRTTACVQNQITVDGTTLPKGLYIVRLQTDAGTKAVKLLLEK
ncbi:Ig-like domain-containing protein [Pontibacter locisalis]|uniref:Ig-like domain-containing protein n=1 Tax=Pontibacter locisalis TaxID=1719035 RepID=A0ABW5IGD6_9BACT